MTRSNVSGALWQKKTLPEIPAEIALITAASPPKWRRGATAGGEGLGFKQYTVREVQPSLLVVDPDISSNEHLGALPDCLSMTRYHTRGGAWRQLLFVSLCA